MLMPADGASGGDADQAQQGQPGQEAHSPPARRPLRGRDRRAHRPGPHLDLPHRRPRVPRGHGDRHRRRQRRGHLRRRRGRPGATPCPVWAATPRAPSSSTRRPSSRTGSSRSPKRACWAWSFAVGVILLFLRRVRPTIITAISIPTSLLIAFIGMLVTGYTLNMLTLAALTISIGRVVDDSMVAIENIMRHLASARRECAPRSSMPWGRCTARSPTSTLATVVVFLPIAIVSGMAGELFRPFALTVGIAMLSSLLVALTIVPVLASVACAPEPGDRGSRPTPSRWPGSARRPRRRRSAAGCTGSTRRCCTWSPIRCRAACSRRRRDPRPGGHRLPVPAGQREARSATRQSIASLTQSLPAGTSVRSPPTRRRRARRPSWISRASRPCQTHHRRQSVRHQARPRS